MKARTVRNARIVFGFASHGQVSTARMGLDSFHKTEALTEFDPHQLTETLPTPVIGTVYECELPSTTIVPSDNTWKKVNSIAVPAGNDALMNHDDATPGSASSGPMAELVL